MATHRILKTLLWVLSVPQIIISLLLEVLAPVGFLKDLDRCVLLTKQYGKSIPRPFIDALILAEDHRNELHPGIDMIAVARVLLVLVGSGNIQGASTIEQQYVRVVCNRYERTMRRKVREQLLALMLLRRIQKQEIASTYLAIAFYGHSSIGLDALEIKFGKDLTKVPFLQALQMVAQLKYPRPINPGEAWKAKIAARVNTLCAPRGDSANKSFQQIAYRAAEINV